MRYSGWFKRGAAEALSALYLPVNPQVNINQLQSCTTGSRLKHERPFWHVSHIHNRQTGANSEGLFADLPVELIQLALRSIKLGLLVNDDFCPPVGSSQACADAVQDRLKSHHVRHDPQPVLVGFAVIPQL